MKFASEMSPSNPEATQPRYAHFILAVWAEHTGAGQDPAWRFSLEDPRTAQRYGFPDLPELVAFLEDWLQQQTAD